VTRSFAIITTDANPDVSEMQDRMPVILEPANWRVWLGEAPGNPASLCIHSPPARRGSRQWIGGEQPAE
jgi:putative SOS response-associated peptidase YedK